MLIGPSAGSLLGNMLVSKGVIQAGEGTLKAGQDF